MNCPFIVYKQAMENSQKLTLCESEKTTISSISLIKLKFQEYHVVYRAFPSRYGCMGLLEISYTVPLYNKYQPE